MSNCLSAVVVWSLLDLVSLYTSPLEMNRASGRIGSPSESISNQIQIRQSDESNQWPKKNLPEKISEIKPRALSILNFEFELEKMTFIRLNMQRESIQLYHALNLIFAL